MWKLIKYTFFLFILFLFLFLFITFFTLNKGVSSSTRDGEYNEFLVKGNIAFSRGDFNDAINYYEMAWLYNKTDLIQKKLIECRNRIALTKEETPLLQQINREVELIPKEIHDLGIVTPIFSDTIMLLDSIYYAKLRIGKPNTFSHLEPFFEKKLSKKEKQISITSADVIEITSEMKAELRDVYKAFEIEALSESIQGIDTIEYTQWEWAIKPIKEGNYPLKIVVAAIKTIEGKEYRNTIPVYETSINIQSKANYFNLSMYASGGMAILALIFLFVKKRMTKDKIEQRATFWKAATQDSPKNIFVIYADEDSNFADKFYTNLYSLIRGGFITLWYEKMIMASELRAKKVNKHLNEADMIVLLMSGNFFASDYCDELLEKAIEREKQENVIIIPVLIRYCTWEISKLANYEVLPKNKEPISSNQWNSQEQAIYQVITEMEGILNSRSVMRAKSEK